MTSQRQTAFFLWVGSELPDIARISVLSAAEAGFETILFTDRPQAISHPALRQADWREVGLPWQPREISLKGANTPFFAGFADLFRYRLLSQNDGWWFDCDTVILHQADRFRELLTQHEVVLGYEAPDIVNNAVIGSRRHDIMMQLYEDALPLYPEVAVWGETGPKLVSGFAKRSSGGDWGIFPPSYFYPVHHAEIARVYLPEHCAALEAQSSEWFCLSLWGEVLSRSGLRYLAPPAGSYLGALLAARPELGGIAGDDAAMAGYLARNLATLETLDSGKVAMRTLTRKLRKRLGGNSA